MPQSALRPSYFNKLMHDLKFPIGIQSFEKIRLNDYMYIDKTGYIPLMLNTSPYIVLSRPRRFGKSLFVSMLESFFKGDRGLFKGLAVDSLIPEEWESHPVIHLDLSGEEYSDLSVLKNKLNSYLDRYESELGLPPADYTHSERLRRIVREYRAKSGKQVVILIDEYDNPITSAIGNPDLQEQIRVALYGFYSSLKSLDNDIYFCLLTGVTKYGHLSVFSGLNNIMDISYMNEFAGICGITEEEMRLSLDESVQNLAKEEGIGKDEAYTLLKEWYDGYHFSKSMVDVYNPFSLINALARKEVSDYWYRTGTPTILIRTLQEQSFNISRLNNSRASEDMLSNVSVVNMNPVALFYQTGYLTIKDYDRKTKLFTLGYPNKEIESGLMDSILNVWSHISDSKVLISDLCNLLENGNTKDFIERLKAFFADIPYDLRRNIERYENYYLTIFYVLLRLIGMDVDAEYHTSEGSLDIVIKTAKYIYIIELIINGTAQDAMKQIIAKQYASPFVTDNRKLIKVGLGFAESTHTIGSYLIEE